MMPTARLARPARPMGTTFSLGRSCLAQKSLSRSWIGKNSPGRSCFAQQPGRCAPQTFHLCPSPAGAARRSHTRPSARPPARPLTRAPARSPARSLARAPTCLPAHLPACPPNRAPDLMANVVGLLDLAVFRYETFASVSRPLVSLQLWPPPWALVLSGALVGASAIDPAWAMPDGPYVSNLTGPKSGHELDEVDEVVPASSNQLATRGSCPACPCPAGHGDVAAAAAAPTTMEASLVRWDAATAANRSVATPGSTSSQQGAGAVMKGVANYVASVRYHS
jgi:hypothetical protein